MKDVLFEVLVVMGICSTLSSALPTTFNFTLTLHTYRKLCATNRNSYDRVTGRTYKVNWSIQLNFVGSNYTTELTRETDITAAFIRHTQRLCRDDSRSHLQL